MFFDLLPHVIRDERLRERVAALYEWYYKMNVEWLGLAERVRPENRERYVAFVSLMVAVVDGLALQAALRPKGFDLERSFCRCSSSSSSTASTTSSTRSMRPRPPPARAR